MTMPFELKKLSADALPRALEKAHLYRLLHEPAEAESICRDVLDVDPGSHDALVTLLLALTDQFDTDPAAFGEARNVAEQLVDEYAHAYYTGVVFERRAKALLGQNVPGVGPRAYEGLREAMARYEEAEAVRPAGNDDALLRWNACARLLMREHHLAPASEEREEPLLLE
jgi:hypothetical protein